MTDDNEPHVLRRGSGQDGEDHLEVSFKDGGERRTDILPVRDLALGPALRSLGILANASRSAFTSEAERALQNMPSTFEVADRSGWFGDTFVWPDGEHTGDMVPVCLGPEFRHAERVRNWGSLELWRRGVFDLARRNSRLMLAFSHAFSGLVADLLEIEAPAIQLVGNAGTFKTSLLSTVASMWGISIKSWHGTGNGIEEVAMCHNATHLTLDDFRVDKRHAYTDLRASAIRLLDGRTKERMGERSKPYCTPVLSTSNRTLDEHARCAGIVNDADQAALRGRLIDVPLLGGRTCMFEELHGHRTPLDLMEALSEVARDNPGRPAVDFVASMADWRREDETGLRHWLIERRTLYEERARATFESPPGYDLTRVHGRFATIYAAGMLAIELRIVRWSTAQLLEVIMACEAAHVAVCAEGGRGDIEGSPLTALRRFIDANWRSFVDLRHGLLDPDAHDETTCPGYINIGTSGKLELLFSFRQLLRVCGGRGAIHVLRSELRFEGILLEGEARPSVKRFIYRGRDPKDRVNVVALRADAFGPFAEGK